MRVKVLTHENNKNLKNQNIEILTSNYVRQLNERISYNILESNRKTNLGKKELVLKKTKN